MSKRALIIQGGGFKTAFSAGVLDAFIAQNFDPFDIYAGVSGGANALSYFLAFQYKSCISSIHVLLDDPKFINYKQFLKSGVFMNVDFFKEISTEIVPLNYTTILQRHADKRIGIVATNRVTGKPEYLSPTPENWISCCIASCSIPFVTKAKHEVNGHECMDGSWSDPLPVRWAIEQGATEILIVRTSAADLHEKKSIPDFFGEYYFNKQPGLKEIFSKSHLRFNDAIDLILAPPSGITIEQIAPKFKLKTGGYTNSKTALELDYRYGLEMGIDYLITKNKNKYE
jgi:predicted patatin/cPLA2 family phospholipase